MPKVVDRQAQRRAIGAALLTVIAERGMDEVSVRTVAAAAGRSAGAVQKYFATKDEMLHFALDLAAEQTTARLQAVSTAGRPRNVLHRLIAATLPLDAERRTECLVWMAFAARAAHRPEFAAVLSAIDDAVRADLAARLDFTDPADRLAAADALIAVSDGLALRMLYAPQEQQSLLSSLDTALDRLTGSPR